MGIVASGLLAAYDFLASGTSLPDVSGGGNAGTLSGSPLPAQVTGGLRFLGGYVTLPATLWQPLRTLQIWADFTADPLTTDYLTLLGSDQGDLVLWSDGTPTSFAPTADLGSGNGMAPAEHLTGANGLTWVLDPTAQSVYWNGVAAAGYVNGQGAPGLSAASTLYLGLYAGIGRPYIGTMYYAALYNRELSAAEIQANHAYVAGVLAARGVTLGSSLPQTAAQVVFDGDSLTRGAAAGWRGDYPVQLMRAFPGVAWTNLGLGGQTAQQIAAVGPAVADPLAKKYRGASAYVLWAGTNDLGTGSGPWRTPAQVYQDLRTRVSAALAAGWSTVVVLTMLPRVSSNVGFAAGRQLLNVAIRGMPADLGSAQVLVADVASDPSIGPDGSNLGSLYAVDNVHLTAAGQAIVASVVAKALNQTPLGAPVAPKKGVPMGIAITNAVKNVGTTSVKALAGAASRQVLAIANKHASNTLRVKFGAAHVTSDVAQVQTITFGATPGSGAFTLAWLGSNASSVASSGAASDVQAALRTISGLGSVTVAGSFAAGFVVTMTGVTNAPVDASGTLLTVAANTLGTAVTVAETTPGQYADGFVLAAGGSMMFTGGVCPTGDVYLLASGTDTRVELMYG